jgi:hypothetical protein
MASTSSRQADLAASHDMAPIHGTVDLDIRPDVLWACFRRAHAWPRWNRCFFWVRNRDLALGEQLVWIFEPIRWFYPYKMFAVARIVELEPGRKVTWEVTALPGFYARHTYSVEPLPDGGSRFGSWEQATGWGFRMMRGFWLAHFTFVRDESLRGGRLLAAIYARRGVLDGRTLPRRTGRSGR